LAASTSALNASSDLARKSDGGAAVENLTVTSAARAVVHQSVNAAANPTRTAYANCMDPS
jgi:hypothetical protein